MRLLMLRMIEIMAGISPKNTNSRKAIKMKWHLSFWVRYKIQMAPQIALSAGLGSYTRVCGPTRERDAVDTTQLDLVSFY